MRNLPTMRVLAERAPHRNVQLQWPRDGSTCVGMPSAGPKMPAKQRLHTWLTTNVGPGASQVQGQVWDRAILE